MVRESLRILKAIEKEGLQGGEGDKSRVVRHRHIHDPGIQQEPRQLRRAFEHILRHRDRIWLTRPRDIYAHIASLPSGMVPGS